MPDHGRSGWSERFDYVRAADTVADTLTFISDDEPWVVVGHSMGGKIAMLLALRHPELAERLCVADVSPVAYREGREFEGFVAAMRAMDLRSTASREEADAALAEAAPDRACAPSCCRTCAARARAGAGR
ncbi:alpha/beta fold hydrolase [Janibacter melonis]|uniref:alpha/beta fold hydrolase n=1 Tax=Janibacter melonis TaxID=262209 RepID=UPI002E2A8433|nr:alpha/beta fold hydrolase [Janibacter melonis]